jgi:thymidylate kinase
MKTIDSLLEGSVIVFGSLPPRGRDLDLLARPREWAVIASLLDREGYSRSGAQWAAFQDCSAFSVELVAAETWRLPPGELAALFEQSTPLDGSRWLSLPAPHHVLLILARRLAWAGGELEDRLASRVEAALSTDPDSWARAEQRASAWKAVAALDSLQRARAGRASRRARARARLELGRSALSSGQGRGLVLRRIRPRRRSLIVAFSGLDGAGKSSQAESLRTALEQLGIEAAVVWAPGGNPLFRMSPALKGVLLRVLGRLGRGVAEEAGAPAARSPDEGPHVAPLPRQRAPVTEVLATVAALAQVVSLRKRAQGAPVVIFDRYLVDAVVYVRHRWGHGRPLRFQRWLMRRLCRSPRAHFFIDVTPETAFARKRDFPIEDLRERAALYRAEYEALQAQRLDGELPREVLCAQIAQEVWARLG